MQSKIPNRISPNDKRPFSPEEFGHYLYEMRTAARLNVGSLCRYLGVSRQTYLNYEAGISLPRDPFAFVWDFRVIIRAAILARRDAGEV